MPLKIKAGSKIVYKNKTGLIGAIIFQNGKFHALTTYHLLKAGNCDLGEILHLNGLEGKVALIYPGLDLVLVELDVSSDEIEISKLKDPYIGPCYALNGNKIMDGRIMTMGKTYHYLSFSYRNLPLPGDSGSPIIQECNVVGILLSVFLNNATGIAASLQKFINK